ncbi:hypothetical protein GCM10017691_12910 [Pseudonocardia petroleophila]|uniref:AAA family ATPase n=1 Tax=Pseudonocardia petroleophila TaxID=37331 RepID=A0A7G7MII3_9PSEU|nr:AAA family ATPase [Pseudonocardia petroleophila]QNG52594.1 AAA family ATPase [Pseudonocardia petroleophila]
MRLVDAHVMNYRSIEDSEMFEVDPEVTCLVGKNEAGKTGLLQALYHLNPVENVPEFDEHVDFPTKRMKQKREYRRDQMIPVVTATFELTPGEVAHVDGALGEGVLMSTQFTLTKGYRAFPGGQWQFQYSERTITAHLVAQLDATAREIVGSAASVEALVTTLEAETELHSTSKAVLEKVRGWGGTASHCVLAQVKPMLPRFVYFEDYDRMPGKIAIPDLAKRYADGTLTRGEAALFNLLSMAGTDPEDFDDQSNHERLIRLLENAGNGISEEVFAFWTQNTGLSVKLDVKPPEKGVTGRLSEGTNLQVRVFNEKHGASVPFDERSRGFVWFFSFLAYFTELEEAQDTDLVLLLDEPGLSLHGRAQEDLLRLIDERLAPKHQVLYTTHSPFMVSSTQFGRVRTVIDHDPGGTRVSAEIFKADDDTAAPLLAAMGIDMSQTLFIGDNTLLLEGPSDLIYIDVLNDALAQEDRITLDPRWVKVPVGGAGKLSTFVTLLGSNKLNVAVLIDSSTKDQGAVRRLHDNGQMRPKALIKLSEIIGRTNADIEDLFDLDFYLALVNDAYSDKLPSAITPGDLNNDDPRVVSRIEQYFREGNINNGHFDHYRPAAVLLRPGAVTSTPSTTTLDLAEQLFERINKLIVKNRGARR